MWSKAAMVYNIYATSRFKHPFLARPVHMFKNLVIYRINAEWVAPDVERLNEVLAAKAYVPCGATEKESHGWIPLRDEPDAKLVEVVDGQMLLRLKSESKKVPPAIIQEALEEQMKKLEQETGRRPGKKQQRDMKQQIELEKLPHAFSKKGATTVWIDTKNHTMCVGAGSIGKCDRIISELVDAMGQAEAPMSSHLLQTAMAPSAGMAHWLSTREAPYQFSVDRECELVGTDDMKAKVRYTRHSLDINQIDEHLQQGKIPTKLALTWRERISVILNDDMTISKIEFLDIVFDNHKDASTGKVDTAFETDVAISTGELSQFIPDLINALDGELDCIGQSEAIRREHTAAGSEGGAEESSAAEPREGLNAGVGQEQHRSVMDLPQQHGVQSAERLTEIEAEPAPWA
jgi:recombination associated protein RdgC